MAGSVARAEGGKGRENREGEREKVANVEGVDELGSQQITKGGKKSWPSLK